MTSCVSGVVPRTVDVDGIPMSALVAEAPRPRAVVVALHGGAGIAAPGPRYEATVVDTWAARDFPELAAQVPVPVHFTLGDQERVWRSGPAALAELAALFGAAPRVAVHEQAGGGHNLSLGLTAMAYHLTVLSFVEECVVGAARRPHER
jgi:hypothetical protein